MAMTAWSAKVSSSSICLSVNGSTCVATGRRDAPMECSFAQHRHRQRASGSPVARGCCPSAGLGIRLIIGDVNDRALRSGRRDHASRPAASDSGTKSSALGGIP